jgi:hypothetical protein
MKTRTPTDSGAGEVWLNLMSDIQAQLEDLKHRVAELEKAEIKLRIQSVGPRGPIGPAGPKGESFEGPAGPQGDRGRDGRNGIDGRTPSKEELESIVATLLTEYHVLDADALPYAGPYAKK